MNPLRKPIWDDIPLKDNVRRFPVPQGNIPPGNVARRFPVIPGYLSQRQGGSVPPPPDQFGDNFYSSSIGLFTNLRSGSNISVNTFPAGSASADRWAIVIGHVGRDLAQGFPRLTTINSVPAEVIVMTKSGFTDQKFGTSFVAYARVTSGDNFIVVMSFDASVSSNFVINHAFRYYSSSFALAGLTRSAAFSGTAIVQSSLFVPANGAGVIETFFTSQSTQLTGTVSYQNSIGTSLVNTGDIVNFQSNSGRISFDFSVLDTAADAYINTSANSASSAITLKEQFGVSFGTVTGVTAPSVVQAGAVMNNINAGVTLSTQPVSGNVLVGFLSHWFNNPGVNSGWYFMFGQNGVAVDGQQAYVKIATGSESLTQLPCSSATDTRNGLVVFEIQNARINLADFYIGASGVPYMCSSCMLTIDPTATGAAFVRSYYAHEGNTLLVGGMYSTTGSAFTVNSGTIAASAANGGAMFGHHANLSSGTNNITYTPGNSSRFPSAFMTFLPKQSF